MSDRLSQSVEQLASISAPTNVFKSSPEEILKQISAYSKAADHQEAEQKREAKSQNLKLGRKGIGKYIQDQNNSVVPFRFIKIIQKNGLWTANEEQKARR